VKTKNSSEDNDSSDDDDDENSVANADQSSTLPNARDYPLLHHLGVKISYKNVHDQIMQEILKFNGGEEIRFMGGSNRPTTMLKVPQPTKVSNLQLLLNRNGSCVDKMVKIMAD
jgi:hypothetical protein